MFCSLEADGGKHEKKENHGVGLAARDYIVAGMGKGDVAVEYISARLMGGSHPTQKGNLTVCLSL